MRESSKRRKSKVEQGNKPKDDQLVAADLDKQDISQNHNMEHTGPHRSEPRCQLEKNHNMEHTGPHRSEPRCQLVAADLDKQDISQDQILRDVISQAVNETLKKNHNMEHTGAFLLTDPRGMDAGDIWISPFTEDVVAEVFPKRGESHVKFTPLAVSKILNNIANCGVMYQAVIGAGLSYSQFAKLRGEYPALVVLIDEAMDLYREKVAHAVHSRAIRGVEEPVHFKGAIVGYIRKYSDRLLELHAKRHCPEYRDKGTLDVNVAGGVLVVHDSPQNREEWLAEHRKKNTIDGEVVSK